MGKVQGDIKTQMSTRGSLTAPAWNPEPAGQPVGGAVVSVLDNPQYKERWAMYDAALQIGLPIVSRETCAIICAMLQVWGNHEMFTHHHRLVCELLYAQKRFKVEGSKSPDAEFAALLRSYVGQLELVQQREGRVPDHIDDLFYERYKFRFNR